MLSYVNVVNITLNRFVVRQFSIPQLLFTFYPLFSFTHYVYFTLLWNLMILCSLTRQTANKQKWRRRNVPLAGWRWNTISFISFVFTPTIDAVVRLYAFQTRYNRLRRSSTSSSSFVLTMHVFIVLHIQLCVRMLYYYYSSFFGSFFCFYLLPLMAVGCFIIKTIMSTNTVFKRVNRPTLFLCVSFLYSPLIGHGACVCAQHFTISKNPFFQLRFCVKPKYVMHFVGSSYRNFKRNRHNKIPTFQLSVQFTFGKIISSAFGSPVCRKYTPDWLA